MSVGSIVDGLRITAFIEAICDFFASIWAMYKFIYIHWLFPLDTLRDQLASPPCHGKPLKSNGEDLQLWQITGLSSHKGKEKLPSFKNIVAKTADAFDLHHVRDISN